MNKYFLTNRSQDWLVSSTYCYLRINFINYLDIKNFSSNDEIEYYSERYLLYLSIINFKKVNFNNNYLNFHYDEFEKNVFDLSSAQNFIINFLDAKILQDRNYLKSIINFI